MLALLVLALALLCMGVKGDWDPDDPINCRYMRIGLWPYDVDNCMTLNFVGYLTSTRYTCQEDGSVFYEFWDKGDCDDTADESEDINDYLANGNEMWANYSSYNCDGQECGIHFTQYLMEDYSDDTCPDQGYIDDTVALETCTWYYGTGYVFECEDEGILVNVYMNDMECRDPWYSYYILDGCHEYNGSWHRYDINAECPKLKSDAASPLFFAMHVSYFPLLLALSFLLA